VTGAIAPICPSGLSMLMAPFRFAGGRVTMFALFPLCGIALVVATFLLGARVQPGVGLASALVIASNPIVVYQAVQPMSDVPAAAFWTLALAAAVGRTPRAPLLAGISAAVAILVRPNLLPLGVVIGVFLLVRPERPWVDRLRHAAVYAVPCAVGCWRWRSSSGVSTGRRSRRAMAPPATSLRSRHIAPNASALRLVAWCRR
jgi:4-amino-4-deoxy-L-arabinose transferase-like glycosyltransferase